MTEYRVDCITKPDRTSRTERIQALGGAYPRNWYDTEANVIAAINSGDTFFTHVNGNRANVVVAWRGLVPYLKTDADSVYSDNLLALPECR